MDEIEKQYLAFHETMWTEIVSRDEEHIKQVICDYAMKKSEEIGQRISVRFLDKEIVDEIIELGTQEYLKRHNEGGVYYGKH